MLGSASSGRRDFASRLAGAVDASGRHGSRRSIGAAARRGALAGGREQQDRAGDGGVERRDLAVHRDAHDRSRRRRTRAGHARGLHCRRRCRADRAGQRRRSVSDADSSAPTIAQALAVEVGQAPARSSTGGQDECSVAPADALIAAGLSGAERRVGIDHAVDAARLGTAQQRAEVLGILERVEHQHERRLAALAGAREDRRRRRRPAAARRRAPRPGGRRSPPARSACRLRPRRPGCAASSRGSPARRGPRAAPARSAAGRLAARREGLLDRPPAGDELLALAEQRVAIDGAARAAARAAYAAAARGRTADGGRSRTAAGVGRSPYGRSARPRSADRRASRPIAAGGATSRVAVRSPGSVAADESPCGRSWSRADRRTDGRAEVGRRGRDRISRAVARRGRGRSRRAAADRRAVVAVADRRAGRRGGRWPVVLGRSRGRSDGRSTRAGPPPDGSSSRRSRRGLPDRGPRRRALAAAAAAGPRAPLSGDRRRGLLPARASVARQPSRSAAITSPALAIARVLDRHAQRSELVAQLVGRCTVPARPCRGALVQQLLRASGSSSALIDHAQNPVEVAQRRCTTPRVRRRQRARVDARD